LFTLGTRRNIFEEGRSDRHPLTIVAVIGTLKGYDQLMNLVLDEVKEALTGRSALDAPVVLY
jgi:hypothetical protein